MKSRLAFFVLGLAVIAQAASGQIASTPANIHGQFGVFFTGENGLPRAVRPEVGNRLPVDANVSVSSVTVNAFPVYEDASGTPTTSTLDGQKRVQTVAEEKPFATAPMAVYTLTPNVAYSIPALADRKTVNIGINTPGGDAWFSTDPAGAAINSGRRFFSSIEATIGDGVSASVISSTAIQISTFQAK
jgi:hypothetical protein